MKWFVPAVAVLGACGPGADIVADGPLAPHGPVAPADARTADAKSLPDARVSPDAPPASTYHRAVLQRGDTLWVVGDRGEILRHDGGGWSVEPSGVTADLYAITADDTTRWIVGANGTVIVNNNPDGVWGRPWDDALPARKLLTVAVADGTVFVGGDGIVGWQRGGVWHIDVDDDQILYSSIAGAHDGAMWAVASGGLHTTLPRGRLYRGGTAGWTLVASAGDAGLPELDFDFLRVDGDGLVLGAEGSPFYSTKLSRGDGATWTEDGFVPSDDTTFVDPAVYDSVYGQPTAVLLDSAGGGVLATDHGLLVTDAPRHWAPFMMGRPVSGLAGTPLDYWAVGAAIWHIVDGKVVEER